jgi:4'-phosphopantetheinyl transferase
MTTLLLSSEADVHVWYVILDHVAGPHWLQRFEAVLSDDETERWQRYAHADKRREYLVSHGFLRHVLSLAGAARPGDWQFTRSQNGKPVVHSPDPALCFNLTHT